MNKQRNFFAPGCAPFRKNHLNCYRASLIFLEAVLACHKKLVVLTKSVYV